MSEPSPIECLTGEPDRPFIETTLEESPCICESLQSVGNAVQLLRPIGMSIVNHTPFSSLRIILLRILGARIGQGVYLSPGVQIDPLYPQFVTIEDGALLGLGSRVLTHEYTTERFRLGRVHIGKGSVIGAFATIRSGVRIGAGAMVGMCSLVTQDVPAGAVVGGIPARPIEGRP